MRYCEGQDLLNSGDTDKVSDSKYLNRPIEHHSKRKQRLSLSVLIQILLITVNTVNVEHVLKSIFVSFSF